MERITTINHNNTTILIEDFSNLAPGPEFNETLVKAKAYISSQPEKSVLALFDATGIRFNQEMVDKTKNFVQENTPYMKSVALIGITGLLKIALQGITRAANRHIKVFPDKQSALDWLSQQS
jgi:hypothetical protein